MIDLTILMSVYNDDDYIEQCISSVLESTYENFIFLIINDGSSDETESIIKKFNDNRIKYLYKKNSGLIDSLNLGLSIINTKYIMRLDGDDFISPNKIYEQINFLERKPNIDLVGTDAFIINNENEIIGKTNLPKTHFKITTCLKKIKPSLIHPSIMFRTDIIKNFFYSKDYIHAEDYELFCRLSAKNKFFNIKKPLMFLRKNDENISKLHIENQQRNTFLANRYHFSKEFLIEEVENSKYLQYYTLLHRKIQEKKSATFILKILRNILKEYLLWKY